MINKRNKYEEQNERAKKREKEERKGSLKRKMRLLNDI